MPSTVYRKLQEQLDQYSVGFPASESGVEIKILEKLFTEDEAELFLFMTLALETAEQIAQRTGRDIKETSSLLETMAEKGLVFRLRKEDSAKYGAIPFVLGIYEFQLNRLDKEFAQLFEEYLNESFYKSMAGVTPLLRTIPISQSLDVNYKVANYEDAEEIVKSKKKIAVTNCLCQIQQDLIDQGCEKPLEVCFVFGSGAQYYLDKGMARQVDVEEALEILKKCHDAGLVVQPASPQNPGGMCNCCGDCCGALRAIKKFPRPAEMVLSNYYAEVIEDECDACEICVDRCEMEAITVEEKAHIDLDRCIGCGLCVTTCPSEAIQMKPKPEDQVVVPPESGLQAMVDLAETRGKKLTPLAMEE